MPEQNLQFDPRHSNTVIYTGAVGKFRFVGWGGAHSVSAADIQGVSEKAGSVGQAGSVVTEYSYPVEAAMAIPAGSEVAPATDGTGRAIVATGLQCGRALTAAAAAGELVVVRLRLVQAGLGAAALAAAQALVSGAGIVTANGVRTAGLDTLRNGAIVYHRGCGAGFAPDNTMSGFKAGLSNGAAAMDIDVRAGTDGTGICMHDSTIDRTTTGTGDPATLDLAGVRALVSDPGTYLAPGWGNESVPTLDDVCREFGNQVVFAVEAKTGLVDEEAILAAFARWGIRTDRAIVTAFDYAWTQRARAAGYPIARWLNDINSTDLAANAANGVAAIGAPNMTAAKVAEVKALGMLAGAWTYNRRSEYDLYVRQYGCDFFVSDEPVYVSGRGLQRRGNQFAGGFWPHGVIPYTTTSGGDGPPRGAVTSAGWWQFATKSANPRLSLLGFLGSTTGSWTLDFTVRYESVTVNNSSFILCVNCPTDEKQGAFSGAWAPGYQINLRADGSVGMWRIDNATTQVSIASLASGGTAYQTTGGIAVVPQAFRISYNASTGVFTILNVTSGRSVSSTADFTYSGGYIHAGRGEITCAVTGGFTLT